MESLEEWISRFNSLPKREVLVYRETEDAIIYEIINQKDESYIGDILMNIYPKEEGRAAKLFK
jgi:cytochrome c oxidase assembly protein Cox11